MAFPFSPIDLAVDLFIDGAWVSAVTTGNGVRLENPVRIRYGRANWSARTETGQADFLLDNRDGRWSPDRSTSPYFGDYRRNIPARIGVGEFGVPGMVPTGVSADMASTPDIAGTGGGSPTTPTVTATTSGESTYVTSHDCDLPATLAATDRLLMVGTLGHTSGAPVSGDITGWTLVETTSMYTFHRCTVYEIEIVDATQATALQGSTIQWTTSTGVRSSFHVYRVQGARSGVRGAAYDATAFTALVASTTPNTPSLTTSWGATANLFLSIFSADAAGVTLSSNPAGYTAVAYSGAQYVNGSASKAVATATDDPGTFTLSASVNHTGLTVAYQPTEDPSTGGILDITGDIDMRIEFQLYADLEDIVGGGIRQRLAHKSSGANGWEWALYNANGVVVSSFTWFDSSGVEHTYTTENTGAALPWTFQHDRVALRVDLDVSTGLLDFYTSDAIGGTWTKVGASIAGPASTSIGENDAPLRVGGNPFDSTTINKPLTGRIFHYRLLNESDTQVANPDFSAQAVGQTDFTDAAGREWDIGTGGEITDKFWRFHGELASLPVRWDTQGRNVVSSVEATGLFRRLRQGNRRLESALRRAILSQDATTGDLVQYWPMEETGPMISRFGAAKGDAQFIVTGGHPNTGTNNDFVASSALATPGDTIWTVTPDVYETSSGEWQVRWLQKIPDDATGSDFHYLTIKTTDMEWHVRWFDASGGNLEVLAYRSGGLVYQTGFIGFESTGKAFRMQVTIQQNGSNVNVNFQGQEQGAAVGAGVDVTNAVAGSAGRVTEIKFNKDSNIDNWAIGHVTLQNAETSTAELATELNAFIGEKAAARIARLCQEEGIASRIEGEPANTEVMGAQRPGKLIDLLEECAATDLGILHESRQSLAVAYRTRDSMIEQTATLALDYAAGEVGAPLQPDRDDQEFYNDVEVQNWTGAKARAVLDDGSVLSVSEPPVGAGRYDNTYEVNTADSQLPALAATYLALAAVDEPRVSRLTLALHHEAVRTDTALIRSMLGFSLGDLITVDNNLDAWNAETLISKLAQGTTDTIENYQHTIEVLTAPATPWGVGGIDPPPDVDHSVQFRFQDTLATPGTPVHILEALGYTGTYPITRAQLDGILDDWVASTGGTLRTADDLTEWQAATAAALPGDLVRATTSFDPGAAGDVRGNRFGIAGATLTASPSGGNEGLPIVFTCADGVVLDDNNTASGQGVVDFANCTHVWPIGMNVREGQFGIRHQNWGGSVGYPAYSAYNDAQANGHFNFLVAGWFQAIATSGGTPPTANDIDEWGYSEWFVFEENTGIDPGAIATASGECFSFGVGSSPGWIGHAKNGWVRGNLGVGYTARSFGIKPGCHALRFTDDVSRSGASNDGAVWQILYIESGLDNRPAWMDFDPEIWVEGAVTYDHNLTKNQTPTSAFAMQVGMCGVTIANCVTWGIADTFGSGTGTGVQFRSEKANSQSQSTDLEKLVVVNNTLWTGVGVSNIGGPTASPVTFPASYIDVRNHIGFTTTTGVEHTATSADFIAPTAIPAIGSVAANANWDDGGPGSAFDLALDSTLITAGEDISDVDLTIDADISQRAIPSPTPNPGAFQPHPANPPGPGPGGGEGTPAPTIPSFGGLVLPTQIAAGTNVATTIAAGSEGEQFELLPGDHGPTLDNVLCKKDMHIRFAAGAYAVDDGLGSGYAFRPVDQNASGVVIGGVSGPGGVRPRIENYGNGTGSQGYGAIMGRTDDILAAEFIYRDVEDWFIYGLDFKENSSNGIKLGSNFTVFDCEFHGHEVTGINGDRVCGGLIHSNVFYWNALNPSTGASSNGAQIKCTWVNGSVGRTSITPVDRTPAQFIVSNNTFEALDRFGGTGDTNIGVWFDLDCQDILVEYNTLDDHPSTSIFFEGCNGFEVKYNTVNNSDGYGPVYNGNFSNAAICAGESTNGEYHHNTLNGCDYAIMNRLSNRDSDWLDPVGSSNYAYSAGPRYWILDTQAVPADPRVTGSIEQSNMWTAAITYELNELSTCDRVVINEGTNGTQTTHDQTPLDSIDFINNVYDASPGIQFYEPTNDGAARTLFGWMGLPDERDNQ